MFILLYYMFACFTCNALTSVRCVGTKKLLDLHSSREDNLMESCGEKKNLLCIDNICCGVYVFCMLMTQGLVWKPEVVRRYTSF